MRRAFAALLALAATGAASAQAPGGKPAAEPAGRGGDRPINLRLDDATLRQIGGEGDAKPSATPRGSALPELGGEAGAKGRTFERAPGSGGGGGGGGGPYPKDPLPNL